MASTERPSFIDRYAMRGLRKFAKRNPNEPLSPADWEAYWAFGSQPSNRAFKRVLRALPSTPRCGFCGAPFSSVGGRLVARHLPEPVGAAEQLELKGKQEHFDARRVRWFSLSA